MVLMDVWQSYPWPTTPTINVNGHNNQHSDGTLTAANLPDGIIARCLPGEAHQLMPAVLGSTGDPQWAAVQSERGGATSSINGFTLSAHVQQSQRQHGQTAELAHDTC